MNSLNWVTLAFAAFLAWSILQGIRRGFGSESGYVLAKLVSLVIGLVAFWLAWLGSQSLNRLALSGHLALAPQWTARLVTAWQQTPGVARAVVFLIVYWLVSGSLQSILMPLIQVPIRLVPRILQRNRLLGGGLGGIVVLIRVVVYGGVVFVALQYISLPALRSQANNSRPYQWLDHRVYQTVLSPLIKSEMPVLARSALAPLTQSINLFAVPTGQPGQERGVLVVPEPIATLARQITVGASTPRQKAYALYEWEIHHIHYDWKKYNDYVVHHQWDQQSPMQTLQTGTGVCADYALLYADMAHSVGLTVQIDEGLGGTSPSDRGSHAWNKIYDTTSSQWLTVDTTWGSQQDVWFNAPHFDATHIQQTEILIPGATH